jgi:hypothetical protein
LEGVLKTQPAKDLPAPDTTGEADCAQAESVEQSGNSAGEADNSVESVEMADVSVERVNTGVNEEQVDSSVEEIDELADDLDIVEETILYQPSLPNSTSTPIVARFFTPVPAPAASEAGPQEDSQCVPDSQAETTEPTVACTRTQPLSASVCESPRKRKSEDGELPAI